MEYIVLNHHRKCRVCIVRVDNIL